MVSWAYHPTRGLVGNSSHRHSDQRSHKSKDISKDQSVSGGLLRLNILIPSQKVNLFKACKKKSTK